MLPLISAVHSATARAARPVRDDRDQDAEHPTPGPATDGQCRSSQWWIRATGIT
jgi:hypothetical protein